MSVIPFLGLRRCNSRLHRRRRWRPGGGGSGDAATHCADEGREGGSGRRRYCSSYAVRAHRGAGATDVSGIKPVDTTDVGGGDGEADGGDTVDTAMEDECSLCLIRMRRGSWCALPCGHRHVHCVDNGFLGGMQRYRQRYCASGAGARPRSDPRRLSPRGGRLTSDASRTRSLPRWAHLLAMWHSLSRPRLPQGRRCPGPRRAPVRAVGRRAGGLCGEYDAAFDGATERREAAAPFCLPTVLQPLDVAAGQLDR